ncbi:MAG: serine/threonine protein kinase [Gemmatimonadetes bacterium]|nr:serine/threonine protein kinase [Gemmatimonadota bacterium]
MSRIGTPGTTISHYRIEAELGRGGMGTVYRATDTLLGRAVAIKIVHPTPLGNETMADAQRRFLREAQMAGAINHPALVTEHAYEQAGDDALIIMELLEGETLAQQLARRQPWNAVHTAMLLAAVCDGLAEAHRRGIVHRDLKPANIMLLPDGRVKVLDFGIAGTTERTDTPARGLPIIGTVDYMSPEQVTGAHAGAAADVFALGTIAYEMMTLERPFGAGPAEQIAARVAGDDPPMLADPALAELRFGVMAPIILRMLDKDPRRRYADAAVLGEALMPIAYQLSPESGVVFPVTPLGDTGPLTGALPAPRPPMPMALVVALSMTLAIALGAAGLYAFGGTFFGKRAVQPPTASTAVRPAAPAPATRPGVATGGPAIVAGSSSVSAPGGASTPGAALPKGDSTKAAPIVEKVMVSSVDVSPPGATIRRLNGDRRQWVDRAELSVAQGDSVPLMIDHPRYQSRKVWFKGRPMRVTLGGGTGTVTLQSPIAAQVEVRATDGTDLLVAQGPAPLVARVAPGRYRATFRARSFDDSTFTVDVREGDDKTLRVAYVATGAVRVEVTNGGATVRIDAGESRPAPAEFTALSPGRHIIHIERGGQGTKDTVVVFPGRTIVRRVQAP